MIIRHDIDPALYLVPDGEFAAVIAVDGHLETVQIAYDNIDEMLKPQLMPIIQAEPEMRFACDGMGCLIRTDWILTAAHVARELYRELSRGMAGEERSIAIAHKDYAIQQIVFHPDADAETAEGYLKNDIALIQLTKPVQEILPLPLYEPKSEPGQTVTFVGRGDFGNGLIGPDAVDGKLRRATNLVEDVTEDLLLFRFDAPPGGTDLEGICGPGDSGGPALMKTDEGWAIAGISSGQDDFTPSGALGESRYGVLEYYIRVSQHIDWINAVVLS